MANIKTTDRLITKETKIRDNATGRHSNQGWPVERTLAYHHLHEMRIRKIPCEIAEIDWNLTFNQECS